MNDRVLEILRSLPSRMKGVYVFPNETGQSALNANNFINRVWNPVRKRANLEDLHWHDLRHTFASRLIMAWVDLRTVQELIGHKMITMTLRYSHLSPTRQREAVQRLLQEPTATKTAITPKSRIKRNGLSARKIKWSRRELNPRPLERDSVPKS